MNAYILLNKNKCIYEKDLKKINYNKSQVKAILIECWHPVFGIFYVAQEFKVFKKFMKYATKSIVSYRFLDGCLVEEDDEDFLFVKNKYWYNNPQDLLSKLVEILINEHIFNDVFWVYNSFYEYIYDNLVIRLKGHKRKKKMCGAKFFSEFVKLTKCVLPKRIIQIKDDRWNVKSTEKAKGICLAELYPNIYFRVDSKIFTIGKYKINSDINLVEDGYTLTERQSRGKLSEIKSLKDILEIYVSKYVIRHLEMYEDSFTYKVKNKIKFRNKKINKKKYKFEKFVRKYFVDIKKY